MRFTLHLPPAILFDAVGTLLRPDPPVAAAYAAIGRRFGSTLSEETIRGRFRRAFARQEDHDRLQGNTTSQRHERRRWQAIVAEVFDDVPDSQPLFEALWDHFAQAGHWTLYDDVPAVLDALVSAGHVLGVASNLDDRLEPILAGQAALAPLRQRFTSSQIGHRKPGARFFTTVQKELGLSGEGILLVGDDVDADYHGARAAGWQALLVVRNEALDGVGDVPRSHCIGSLHELLGLESGLET